MHRLTASPQVLQPGQSLKLPDGQGTITFTGYVPWVSLAITHDPGQLPALICGIAALGGLLLSFMIRRGGSSSAPAPALRPRARAAPRCRSAAWPGPTRAAASRRNSPRWPPS